MFRKEIPSISLASSAPQNSNTLTLAQSHQLVKKKAVQTDGGIQRHNGFGGLNLRLGRAIIPEHKTLVLKSAQFLIERLARRRMLPNTAMPSALEVGNKENDRREIAQLKN